MLISCMCLCVDDIFFVTIETSVSGADSNKKKRVEEDEATFSEG